MGIKLAGPATTPTLCKLRHARGRQQFTSVHAETGQRFNGWQSARRAGDEMNQLRAVLLQTALQSLIVKVKPAFIALFTGASSFFIYSNNFQICAWVLCRGD